jgi:DNA topoisomerase I
MVTSVASFILYSYLRFFLKKFDKCLFKKNNVRRMTNLVIVESPAKCQKIQGFLGPGWRVIASMGHIRALEETLDAIGLDRDFEPKYQFLKEKAKAIKQLKEAAADATTVYLASDDDREGEAISYAVCLLLKLNPKTTKRAVFHEITKKAVTNAVNSPRYLDMNRVNAQQSRAILDMMIGFTMSPLLWRYVAPSLSAGRCQTPALRLVVEREDIINNFKASSSWQLSANWITAQGAVKNGFKFSAQMDDELEDEESALNYMEIVNETQDGTIIANDIRPWSQGAPEPLITSTLQQQASAMFSINPKNCMKIAQRLYEAGHITYMRTDKAVISEEATAEAKKWVQEAYGEDFLEKSPQKEEIKEEKKTKKKPKVAQDFLEKSPQKEEVKAQEAHEAIRPTHMDVTTLPEGDWSAYDKKVYNLIWQRTIQSVMAPAKGETCKIKTQIEGDDDFTWSSQWKRTTFEGWKRAGKVAQIDDSDQSGDEDSKDDAWSKASQLAPGDKVKWQDMKAEPKETKAQGRYTEATLVRELEKFGIGRPSTFASLIATIQDKNYVETKDIPAKEVKVKEYSTKPNQWPAEEKELKKKVGAEKNKLVPTDLGRSVLSFVLKHFNDLFDYGFTAQMEKRLDQVAEGSEQWKQVLRDMWASYKDRYEDLCSKQSIKAKDGSAKVREFSSASNGLKAVQTKKGPLLLIEGAKKEDTQFIGWPTGVAFEDMTEEKALKFKDEAEKKKRGDEVGEWNGQQIVKKTGKFGDYLQCGEVSIPFQACEELDKTIERFEAKQNGGANIIKQFKEYVIRTGQYGPYIMKTSLKKPQFVSLPKGVDGSKLTEKEVEALYKTGLDSKKKWNADKSNKKILIR